mgnify:CR=1 FL=1
MDFLIPSELMKTCGTAHKISAPIFIANSREVTTANCEDSPKTKPQLSPKGLQAFEKSISSLQERVSVLR